MNYKIQVQTRLGDRKPQRPKKSIYVCVCQKKNVPMKRQSSQRRRTPAVQRQLSLESMPNVSQTQPQRETDAKESKRPEVSSKEIANQGEHPLEAQQQTVEKQPGPGSAAVAKTNTGEPEPAGRVTGRVTGRVMGFRASSCPCPSRPQPQPRHQRPPRPLPNSPAPSPTRPHTP